MKRRALRLVLRSAAVASIVAALICAGLAAYCAGNVASFYAGAQQLDGTIVGVTKLPGGNAPRIEFVDDSGLRHVEQFGPFYKTDADAVGEHRTVLYNSAKELGCAIASPRNWVGSIVYGSSTVGLLLIGGILIGSARKPSIAATTANGE
jgi:hypothetical protein